MPRWFLASGAHVEKFDSVRTSDLEHGFCCFNLLESFLNSWCWKFHDPVPWWWWGLFIHCAGHSVGLLSLETKTEDLPLEYSFMVPHALIWAFQPLKPGRVVDYFLSPTVAGKKLALGQHPESGARG